MPYTAIEAIDIRYSTPTLRSATYKVIVRPKAVNEVPHGMTAAIMIEGTSVMTGAQKNTRRSALPGVNSSLKINFTASAIGCNKPCGPARFGPIRTCRRANARRSYQVRYAKPVNNASVTTSALINHSSQRVQSEIMLSPSQPWARGSQCPYYAAPTRHPLRSYHPTSPPLPR